MLLMASAIFANLRFWRMPGFESDKFWPELRGYHRSITAFGNLIVSLLRLEVAYFDGYSYKGDGIKTNFTSKEECNG